MGNVAYPKVQVYTYLGSGILVVWKVCKDVFRKKTIIIIIYDIIANTANGGWVKIWSFYLVVIYVKKITFFKKHFEFDISNKERCKMTLP